MLLFSIIIPVYNTEAYLNRCLDSIVSQSYKNFEVILVNDGSPDNSGRICDEYANLDNRFHVIHKNNEGVSVARNIGLSCANGDWIAFVDSDDYVDGDWLETMSSFLDENIDIYTWGNYYEEQNGQEWQSRYIPEVREYKNATEFIKTRNYRHGSMWYLYKKAWIQKYNCCFPKGICRSEDQCFLLQFFCHNPRICSIGRPFYHYVRNQFSVTQSLSRIDQVEDNLKVALLFAKYSLEYSDVDKDFVEFSVRHFFYDYISYITHLKQRHSLSAQQVIYYYYKKVYRLVPDLAVDKQLKGLCHSIFIMDCFSFFEKKKNILIQRLKYFIEKVH